MKDHQIAQLVNDLRDVALEFHHTQQLRERITQVVRAALASPVAAPAPITDELLAQEMANAECQEGETAWQYLSPGERRTWLAAAARAKVVLRPGAAREAAQPQAESTHAVPEMQRFSCDGEGGMEVDSLGAWVQLQDVLSAWPWTAPAARPIGFGAPAVVARLREGGRWGGARITPHLDEEEGTTAALYAAAPSPFVDRSDAVNLARNVLSQQPLLMPTEKGVRLLCDAVLRMDRALQQP